LLRAARAERNLSIQQIADDLHLDVRVVEAIESNNFALLGPPVYSRGHLRKYATLVGLAPEVIISHYEMLTDVPVVPAPVPASVVSPPPQERMSFRKPLLVLAGIAAAALVLWAAGWVLNRLDSEATVTDKPDAVDVPPPPVVEAPAAAIRESMPTETEATTSPAEARPVAAESPVANAGNDVTMRLRFTESSWVEIYDATDRRLLYEIGQAGQTRTLAGQAPLRVTLGLASAVAMEVNDRVVPVPRRAGKDAARFVVAADGSVR
jgi:cytoskeleton protein RodZ